MGNDMFHSDLFSPFHHDYAFMPFATPTLLSPQPARQTPAERSDAAAARFGEMGCARALATAYADLAGLSEHEAANLVSGFGRGMGRQLTCGAVTVMLMLAGLAGKGEVCEKLIEEFELQTGSSSCDYFMEKHDGYAHCPHLVRYAGELLNRHVFTPEQRNATACACSR